MLPFFLCRPFSPSQLSCLSILPAPFHRMIDLLQHPQLSLFLFSLCQGWGAACNFFTASSASLFHPPPSPVFFFQSPSSPAFFTSLFTQSSHLSLGLPRLLLPCSRNYAALFGSLSSAILSTCPAHCNLLPTSLSVKLLCTPVSSLNSTILRMSHHHPIHLKSCSLSPCPYSITALTIA